VSTNTNTLELPRVASREQWLAARKELLVKEKELTLRRDELNIQRRELPMVEIDKDYVFECPAGQQVRLLDLFEGRRQLIVYHFMFDPADPPPGASAPWSEGCPGCSYFADNIPPFALEHLHQRETTLVLISRAPQAKIAPFKARMGWQLPWYSSFGSDFNYDLHVTIDPSRDSTEWNYQNTQVLVDAQKIPDVKGELPGISVFLRDGDKVYHTYSSYGRGLDTFLSAYQFLDVTPFGRGEGWDGMPDVHGKGMHWVEHRDKYGDSAEKPGCCHCD
jgi:predicted dithiol-disulfide oxidoreductase (DUF899 family)